MTYLLVYHSQIRLGILGISLCITSNPTSSSGCQKLAFCSVSLINGLTILPCSVKGVTAISRRQFGAAIGALSLAGVIASSRLDSKFLNAHGEKRVVVCTDFSVPHIDPDDYYDVACGIALGVAGFVLDKPTNEAIDAISEIGGRVLEPNSLIDADSVVVVGSASNIAQYFNNQRVILFSGDSQGVPEYNQNLDIDAYNYILPRSLWVPCFSGGLWRTDETASWIQTTDDELLENSPIKPWFEKYVTDAYGLRNLWAGPLVNFAWVDSWNGHSVSTGKFLAGNNYVNDMVSGTKHLLATLSYESRG